MSSDRGLGNLLGGTFGGRTGIGRVLQDLLSGPQTPASTAPSNDVSDKVNTRMPDDPAAPIEDPHAAQQSMSQPGMSQTGTSQMGTSQAGMSQAEQRMQDRPGMQQGMQDRPGMQQPGMQDQPEMQPPGMQDRPRTQQEEMQNWPGMQQPRMQQSDPGMPETPIQSSAINDPAASGSATRMPATPMPAGPSGTSAAPGGLGSFLDRLRGAGLDDQVTSWLSDGPNKSLQPKQLANAIGPQKISDMAVHAGVSPDDITTGLAKALPEVVDKMTPHGDIPAPSQTQQTVTRLFG